MTHDELVSLLRSASPYTLVRDGIMAEDLPEDDPALAPCRGDRPMEYPPAETSKED